MDQREGNRRMSNHSTHQGPQNVAASRLANERHQERNRRSRSRSPHDMPQNSKRDGTTRRNRSPVLLTPNGHRQGGRAMDSNWQRGGNRRSRSPHWNSKKNDWSNDRKEYDHRPNGVYNRKQWRSSRQGGGRGHLDVRHEKPGSSFDKNFRTTGANASSCPPESPVKLPSRFISPPASPIGKHERKGIWKVGASLRVEKMERARDEPRIDQRKASNFSLGASPSKASTSRTVLLLDETNKSNGKTRKSPSQETITLSSSLSSTTTIEDDEELSLRDDMDETSPFQLRPVKAIDQRTVQSIASALSAPQASANEEKIIEPTKIDAKEAGVVAVESGKDEKNLALGKGQEIQTVGGEEEFEVTVGLIESIKEMLEAIDTQSSGSFLPFPLPKLEFSSRSIRSFLGRLARQSGQKIMMMHNVYNDRHTVSVFFSAIPFKFCHGLAVEESKEKTEEMAYYDLFNALRRDRIVPYEMLLHQSKIGAVDGGETPVIEDWQSPLAVGMTNLLIDLKNLTNERSNASGEMREPIVEYAMKYWEKQENDSTFVFAFLSSALAHLDELDKKAKMEDFSVQLNLDKTLNGDENGNGNYNDSVEMIDVDEEEEKFSVERRYNECRFGQPRSVSAILSQSLVAAQIDIRYLVKSTGELGLAVVNLNVLSMSIEEEMEKMREETRRNEMIIEEMSKQIDELQRANARYAIDGQEKTLTPAVMRDLGGSDGGEAVEGEMRLEMTDEYLDCSR